MAGAPVAFQGGSVGRGIGIGVISPEHVLAQLGAHGLHLVLGQLGALGVEEGAAVLVLGDPLAGEHPSWMSVRTAFMFFLVSS